MENGMDKIIIIDFGGQYNQLIARKVREMGVYSELLPYDTPFEVIQEKQPVGVIFTGGPNSVTDADAPTVDKRVFDMGIPIFGICYGLQLIAHLNGGTLKEGVKREYGKTAISYETKTPLFANLTQDSSCWMSHTYSVDVAPEGFNITASTENCKVAAFENVARQIYGVQFHPEVTQTTDGAAIIKNFVLNICKAVPAWNMNSLVEEKLSELRDKIGDKKALLALSGGVDSSVAGVLLQKAIGQNLTCVFVDTGLMRHEEGDQVEHLFKDIYGANFVRVNAQERFYGKLSGVTDPELKRRIIGEEFIRIFEEEAKKIGKVDFFVQGTIYSDVVESGTKTSATIKTHHNVGGLPDVIDFEEIVEPLRDLFKDEVRKLGIELGMPREVVYRQPFPGPGLAVRILGEVTGEKVKMLQRADHIFTSEMAKAGLDKVVWQYFAVLTNSQAVGAMGDERTYGHVVALRGVQSEDAMTATWSHIPYEVLEEVSIRIVNEVKGITRVVYDITSKPPGTIEWE